MFPFQVTSNDRGDKNLQFQIKVREKKRKPISNIEVTTKPTDLQTLYVITVYQSSLAVLVQGNISGRSFFCPVITWKIYRFDCHCYGIVGIRTFLRDYF